MILKSTNYLLGTHGIDFCHSDPLIDGELSLCKKRRMLVQLNGALVRLTSCKPALVEE